MASITDSYIPRRLDDAWKIGLWDIDIAAAPFFFAMVGWLESATLSNTLTISEFPEFIEVGGMIGLVSVGGRYRFDVNLGSVRRAELRMSSYLLKLARTVK